MPVKKEPSGRRSVEAQVEVPGTPEDVWRAIATGPGILVVVRADNSGRESRRQYQIELRPGHGFRRQDHCMGANQALRRRNAGRPGHSRHRVDRRGQGRRHMRGSGRAQLVREHGRLGWPVRGPQLWLDRILPEPAALSPTLLWPAVSNRGPFRDVERQGCLGPPGWSTGIGRRKCRCMLRDVGWVAGAERRRRNRKSSTVSGSASCGSRNPSPELRTCSQYRWECMCC